MGLIHLSDHKRIPHDSIPLDDCIFFCGPSIDDRGRAVHSRASLCINTFVIDIQFDIEDYSVSLNGKKYPVIRSNNAINQCIGDNSNKYVFLDITTLGFVELLLILKWFKSSDFTLMSSIYAEPKFYKSRVDYMSDYGGHEFDLTSHSGGFKAVPGFARAVSTEHKATLISVLGFERSRLGQLLLLDEGAYIKNIIPIFGTPSFKVGWDKHCFFQNVESLKSNCDSPCFVSAYSALEMLEKLTFINESLIDREVMIAPFGSKPLGLGVAVFLINNPNIILKYDHPIKKNERSVGIGRVHMFSINK